jgi:hypothetical protein
MVETLFLVRRLAMLLRQIQPGLELHVFDLRKLNFLVHF